MAQFDMSKLSTADRIVAGAGVVALIALFLPWYGWSGDGVSYSVSGFSSGYGWLGALLVVAAGAYLVMQRSGSNMPKTSVGPAVTVLGASIIGALLVIIRWVSLPSGHDTLGSFSYGPGIGIYLALLAGVVQAFFAYRLYKGSGEKSPFAAK